MFLFSPRAGRSLVMASGFAIAALVANSANANHISLIDPEFNVQHTENAPCVLSQQNCSQQPDTFDAGGMGGANPSELQSAEFNGVSSDTYVYGNINADPNPDMVMTTWLVGDVLSLLGDDRAFSIGIDISDNGNTQSLLEFDVSIIENDDTDGGGDDSVSLGLFTGSAGNIPVTENPGSGFADWLLGVYIIPESVDDGDFIKFSALLGDLNNGPDQFFIVSEEAIQNIPVPASLPLLIGALAGLGLLGRRRQA